MEDLIHDILQSTANEKKVKTEINSNIEFIKPKDLVPVALIFNELVTNSIKHAFTNSVEGEILISALINEKNKITITYSDNGTWTERPENSTSLGLELIESFVDQLDGELIFEKQPNTHYIIRFEFKD